MQAVANLLFHPTLIPTPLRFAAIDRGLQSYDEPYLALAAVVGLQQVRPDEVPEALRATWRELLLQMVRSRSILASRASVTLFTHLPAAHAGELLALYPVPDSTASRNIIAYALSRFGDLTGEPFRARLPAALSEPQRLAFEQAHDDFVSRNASAAKSGDVLKAPSLSYIPNRSQLRWTRTGAS